jgi:hypothetical protein
MITLLSLVLVLVLPSLAGAVLLSRPSRSDPEDAADHGTGDAAPDTAPETAPDVALACGLACGSATWLLGSGLLARTVGLSATSAWLWDALVAAGSVAVLLLPRHRMLLRAVLGPVGRRIGEVGGLAALVFLPLGAVVVRTSWSPLGSTPWYYYGLARQVADLGHIPATSVEFGTTTPFLNDYHLFTTGTAMLLVQQPGDPMLPVRTITVLSILLLVVGMVALTSALGADRLTALLAVPIVIAAGIAPIRASGYRPETFGLGLGLLMAALSVDWLRHRRRGSLVGAALLAATVSQVHGIAALTSGVLVAAFALVSVVRGPHLAQLRRVAIAIGALLGAVAVAGLVFHEASGTVHAGGLVDRGGLADPTWEFFRAARGNVPSVPLSNTAMIRQSVRELYSWQERWMIPALLLAVCGLWRARRMAVTREMVSFTLVSVIGLAAVASVFMVGWQGYVPRRTGASRMVAEASVVGPPLLAIGLSALARATWVWRGRPLLRTPWQRTVALLSLLSVLSVCGVVSMVRVARYDDGWAPSRAELATWRSLPLTSHDVVLANGYTEGFIPDVTGAQGLLDGRAPYTFDAQLRRANSLLRGAHAFFTDPEQNWSFLSQNHVTWVVVGDPSAYSLATGNVWDTPASLRGLDSCPGLRQVEHSATLTVYRVVDPSAFGCVTPGQG